MFVNSLKVFARRNNFSPFPIFVGMLPKGFREHTNSMGKSIKSMGKSTKSLGTIPKYLGMHTESFCASLPVLVAIPGLFPRSLKALVTV